LRLIDARFLTTAVAPKGYPPPDRPEFAFVGRSNVGKSSMINAITGRKKLVRVSRTPGRTRALNFFDVDLDWKAGKRGVRLADLPGYGFAKVSKSERTEWESMITTYLETRTRLSVIVSIVDAEIGPTPEDEQVLGYLQSHTEARLLVAATKIDRLAKARRKPQLVAISEQLALPREAVYGFSATDKLGVDEIWGALLSTAF